MRQFGWTARPARFRKAFLFAAFAALSLLLLRPVCDALAAPMPQTPLSSMASHDEPLPEDGGHGGNHSPGCCATIEDGSLVKPASTIVSGGTDGGWVALHAPFAFFPAAAPRVRPHSAPSAPPPPRSFYARSARIRR